MSCKGLVSRMFVVWTLVALSSSRLAARDPDLREVPRNGRFQVRAPQVAPPAILASRDGLVMRALTPAQKEAGGRLLLRAPSRGDGGGADVADMIGLQIAYSDPIDGNVVLLLWTENTSNNPAGVNILIDDRLLGTLPGVPDDELPDTNGVSITGILPGEYNFKAVGGGTTGSVDQEVVAVQPFADAEDLTCTEGVPNPDTGNCELLLTWTVNGTEPTVFSILLDDVYLGDVPGTRRNVTIPEVPPGPHRAIALGFLENEGGLFRGSFIETTCDLTCEDKPCSPPSSLGACQVEYGPGPTDNTVWLSWSNGESPYGVGVNVFQDSAPIGSLTGDSEDAFLGSISPGIHTFGVQGDCSTEPPLVSTTTDATLELLTATPHPNPVLEPPVCEFKDEGGVTSTTATWTNADPSDFVLVYVRSGDTLFLIVLLSGTATTVTINNTAASDMIVLQFLKFVNGSCYGSELVECSGGAASYIQGVCNGDGKDPQITSAIFGLNYMFLGGDKPPCVKACDSNGDGRVDLSDMVFILSFLFLGGDPFPTWANASTPTCTAVGAEDDCETANPACPL